MDELMGGWMVGWLGGQTDECLHELTAGWTCG